MLLSVTLNSPPITAMLDSSAAQSAVTKAAAAAAGVDAAALRNDPAARAIRADGNVVFMHDHRFDPLGLGGSVSHAVRLQVGGLRHHRVWIGYGTRRLFIAG